MGEFLANFLCRWQLGQLIITERRRLSLSLSHTHTHTHAHTHQNSRNGQSGQALAGSHHHRHLQPFIRQHLLHCEPAGRPQSYTWTLISFVFSDFPLHTTEARLVTAFSGPEKRVRGVVLAPRRQFRAPRERSAPLLGLVSRDSLARVTRAAGQQLTATLAREETRANDKQKNSFILEVELVPWGSQKSQLK